MQKSARFLTTNQWMVFAIFCVGVLNISFAEKIPIGEGFGWDGFLYGTWAKDFFNEVFVKKMNMYYVQKILQSAIVHYGLRLFHLPLENSYVIRGFEILNLSSLLIAAYTWGLIADELKLNDKGKWLGWCGLFVNFAVLKSNFYYPVAVDTVAFAAGFLLLYFYLRGNSFGLLAVAVIGAFNWVATPIFALILFVFPRNLQIKTEEDRKKWLDLLIPVLAGSVVLAGIISTHFIKHYHSIQPAVIPVLNLSIVLLVTYVFFAFYYLFRGVRIFDWAILRALSVKKVTVALLVFLLLKLVVYYLSNGLTRFKPGYLFERSIAEGIQSPLINVISHTVLFGPFFIIFLFLWKAFCRVIRPYGMGLLLVVAFGVSLTIMSEARRHLSVFPFFVAFTLKVIDTLHWKSSDRWLVIALSLLYSKVWLLVTHSGPLAEGPKAYNLQFPAQYYLMSHGPTMSSSMYIAQGSVILATAFLFYVVLFQNRKTG